MSAKTDFVRQKDTNDSEANENQKAYEYSLKSIRKAYTYVKPEGVISENERSLKTVNYMSSPFAS